MSLCARLKSEGARLGFSQTDFAAIAGASKHAQINLEKGTASPNAMALAAWAELDLDVLLVVCGAANPESRSRPAAAAEEVMLMLAFRRCSGEAQALIIETASLLSAGNVGHASEA